jgi:hypothetical protein
MVVLGWELTQGTQWMLGIAGALIGMFLTYRLGLFQASIARKAAAAAAFRSAINSAIANVPAVDEHWGSDIDTTMRELRRAVSIAVADFKPYLSIRGQVLFETAFQKFRVQIENGIPHALNTGMIIYGAPDGARNAKQEVFTYLNELLAYAQQK